MLTFFRRIRQTLLGTGQTRKYILYAFGEIALVVIGILIALQINNWNEARKERILGNEYLAKIYTDLKNDFIKLQYILDQFEVQNESALAAAKIMESENQYLVDTLKYRDDLKISSLPVDIERQRNTWDELILSGSQNIYRDDWIRSYLNFIPVGGIASLLFLKQDVNKEAKLERFNLSVLIHFY